MPGSPRKKIDVIDMIGIQGIADLFDVTDRRVREWHERNTDDFADLRLNTPDSNLAVYSERDVRDWGLRTGRLDAAGNPVRRPPGRRPKN